MKKYIIIFSVILFIAVLLYAQPGPISPFILRFVDLIDTPSTLTGNTLKYVRVNAGETDLEFAAIAGGGDILADGSVPFTGEETFGAGAVFKNGATSAGYIDIYEDTDDGGNYTKIQAVAQAGDITYSLPPDDGDAGEQLQTDGSGVLTWEAAGSVAYQQVVTVAKSGGDYTTIQGAINSIADATTNKRYVVRVMSGVYTEAVTCKDYVDILGAGRTNTIIAGTSGTVLTFPATKCTVSEVGINVDYGALGAHSTAITSAGADSVLKDCDITVTKSGGDFRMNGLTITAGSFRMSDCYFTFTDTGATAATQRTQSAIKQTGVVTNIILNNNEITASTTDTNDDLTGVETTATVTGTCLLANNVMTIDTGAAGSSATGIWAYGTCSGAIFNQNRLTVNCNASSYGIWIDSTAGGAVIDTRHNELIVTSVGAALSAFVAVGDTWNSSLDKITAASGYTNNGTVKFTSSPIDGNFTVNGVIHAGIDNDKGDIEIHDLGTLKFWDDGDDTSVTLGPVADGTTVLGITGTINPTTLQEGGTGVYNITESDAAYQPLEATLTDIADGTINENLINTANPWAVNEGGTGAASLNNLITLTTHTTGNYAAGDAEAGNALSGDAALNFFGAGVTAVTDGTACTDIEGTGLSIAAGTLNWAAASTDLTDTADLLYELELDTFVELDTQIADKALVNKADGAVWLGIHDFGGATSFEIVNDANPTTNATGEIALDTTITDHQPLLQYYDGGENMTVIAIDTAQLPALDNEIVKYDAATDKFVLEADVGAGGGNDTFIEEGDAARVNSSAADLYVDFDATDFDVGVVGNEANVSIPDDGHAHTAASLTMASTDLTDTADLLYETELDEFSELQAQIADKTLVNTADGATWLGNHDFGGADLELPQASPGVPDADGEVELDFTDGKMIIQHGSAHAELGSSTDVAMASLIHSFSGTIFAPDQVNDVITVKAINSIEFPHGIVITAVYLGIASDTTYTLTVQNFDDFDTINAGNPTIDTVTYTADTTGEIIDTTPTYSTIAAGQIIMISIPATDVDWINFCIYYYEPAA